MGCLSNLQRVTYKPEMVMSLIKLYKHTGKEFYYQKILKPDHDSIVKQTIEEDTFMLTQLFGLCLTENRLRLLITKNSEPKTKEEHIATNLKNIVKICCESIDQFDYNVNQVVTLAQRLFKNVKDIKIKRTKKEGPSILTRNDHTPGAREELDKLFELFRFKLNSNDYEDVTLITNFYIDFINIAPLESDNEFIGLLLLYILLFKRGFKQFMYVSFFHQLFDKLEAFNQMKNAANYNWKDGFSHTEPLSDFITQMLLTGYENLEKIIRDYEYDNKLNKADNIENTINKLERIFTKDDIRARHPYVSDSTINRTLQSMRDQELIKPLGVGRSAKWIKTYDAPEKFNPQTQLDIFADEI